MIFNLQRHIRIHTYRITNYHLDKIHGSRMRLIYVLVIFLDFKTISVNWTLVSGMYVPICICNCLFRKVPNFKSL